MTKIGRKRRSVIVLGGTVMGEDGMNTSRNQTKMIAFEMMNIMEVFNPMTPHTAIWFI